MILPFFISSHSSKKGREMTKQFPQEFRLRAVEMVRVGDRPVSHVARELGVSYSALWRWVAEDGGQTSESAGTPGAMPGWDSNGQSEVARLRREVRRLETENLFLKRAATYFAKECALPLLIAE